MRGNIGRKNYGPEPHPHALPKEGAAHIPGWTSPSRPEQITPPDNGTQAARLAGNPSADASRQAGSKRQPLA